jgi:hypothetical protein
MALVFNGSAEMAGPEVRGILEWPMRRRSESGGV